MSAPQMVPLADIERVASIAPDMPARQVAEMLRWIAELQAIAVVPRPCDDDVTRIMGMKTVGYPQTQIFPIPMTTPPINRAEPVAVVEPDPQPAHAPQSYAEKARASIKAARQPTTASRSGVWTDAEIREAMALKNRGKTHSEIARELGRTTRAIDNLMHRQRAKTAAKPAPTPTQQPAAPVQPVAAKSFIVPDDFTRTIPSEKIAPPSSLTAAQRDLMARIMQLDDDFTPADDLYLVDAIIGRTPFNVIADQLGCDIPTVKARWVALVGFDPTKRPGGLPLEAQADLLAVVRALAEGEAA